MTDLVELAGGCAPDIVTLRTPGQQVACVGERRFELTVEGESIAKGRPKLATVGGHARAFTPARTRRYEDIVRQRATQAWNGRPLIADTPITMRLLFVREVPKSWPKKRRAAALLGEIRPTSKPDWSNLCKSVEDALNGVVFYDDSLVVSAVVDKVYGDRPRVELALTW